MTKFGWLAERIEVAVLMMWNSNLADVLQKVMKIRYLLIVQNACKLVIDYKYVEFGANWMNDVK